MSKEKITMGSNAKYTVSLSFESVSLPPFEDILLLGRKCPHGKAGIFGCMRLLSPDNFEMVEVDDEMVEAALISKQLLKRMPQEEIVRILRENVFPLVSKGELVKVDFKVCISFNNITGRLETI